MATEIERKFLVTPGWTPPGEGVPYMQGYLQSGTGKATVRARIAGDKAYLTIKGAQAGISRLEYEYEIPVSDAREMLKELALGSIIEKKRHFIPIGPHLWEVDVFAGENEGLVVAEVELSAEGEEVVLPPWVSREVSDDRRYANASLANHPYSEWKESVL